MSRYEYIIHSLSEVPVKPFILELFVSAYILCTIHGTLILAVMRKRHFVINRCRVVVKYCLKTNKRNWNRSKF